MPQLHRTRTPQKGIHVVTAYEFADAAALAAAIDPDTNAAVVAADIGKVARKMDDDPATFWMLTSVSPITWTQFAQVGGGGGGEANTGTNLGTTGPRIFAQKNGTALEFRRPVPLNASMLVAETATTVTFAFAHLLTQALSAANQIINRVKSLRHEAEFDAGTSGATPTINWEANGAFQRLTLTANATLSFTAPALGVQHTQLHLIQDATGGRSVAWPANVVWVNNAAPSIQSGAGGAHHFINFFWDGANFWGQPSPTWGTP